MKVGSLERQRGGEEVDFVLARYPQNLTIENFRTNDTGRRLWHPGSKTLNVPNNTKSMEENI